MAMTKKELAEWQEKLDDLGKELQQANQWNAFRRTDAVSRDVSPPQPLSGDYRYGWNYNAYSRSISYYWTSSISHGTLEEGKTRDENCRTGSQGPVHLYSTKVKALQALRHAIEKESAQALFEIDQLIQEEVKNTGKNKE